MSHAAEFWRETERYHDLAQSFEENIAITHPPYVTGMCWCSYRCQWPASTVNYYEYRGESLK